MQTIDFGDSGIRASALAMGSDILGSKIGRETAFRLLDYYFDAGGTLVDTANFYAAWLPGCKGGESETVVGQWMKARGNRDRVLVSSKLGFDYPGSAGGLNAFEIANECDKSLKRLDTDRLDIYYAHKDDDVTPQEETMQAFDKLVRAGKVRLLGASNLNVWRIAQANTIAKANGWAQYAVIQQRYTYVRPRHGADFGPQIFLNGDTKSFAKVHGITLIAYSVLLSGAYTRSDRSLPPQFAGPDSDVRIAALNEVARNLKVSANQVVLAWLRRSDPQIMPIIAGSSTDQFKENLDALNLTLTPEEMNKLDTAGNPTIETAWMQPT